VQELDKILDLIRLQSLPKGRHIRAAIVDLMLDLRLLPALADHAEVRAALPSSTVCTVTVLASFFVEEHGSQVAGLRRRGLDGRSDVPR